MLFSFKKELEDFVVQEELAFNLDGTGDFFFVLFEKRGENTMEIVHWLCEVFKIERKEIGIAGLKDKDGITQQWLSIGKRVLKRIGGECEFLRVLCDRVKVIKTDWNSEPLAVGKNKGNFFKIRIRNQGNFSKETKHDIEERLNICLKRGFPNTFGIQRFGKRNKNYKKALKLFQSDKTLVDTYEVKFKLQAFGSMRFNECVMRRWENKDFLLEGDIMVNGRNAFGTQVAVFKNNKLSHFDYRKTKEDIEGKDVWEPKNYIWESDMSNLWYPTGMVLGTEQLLCPTGSLAREYDDWILERSGFLKNGAGISKKYHLYGFRRPLFVIPKNLEWRREDSDLLLNFFLPTGAYASSFLANILGEIDPIGCQENGLIVPRPEMIEE